MDAGAGATASRRVIVVGGSGDSIGAAIAQACELAGHATMRMQRSVVTGANCFQLDLRWEARRIQAAVHAAIDELDGCDWLVLAGGCGAYQRPLHGIKEVEEWEFQIEEQLATNLVGQFIVLESSAPLMRRDEHEEPSRVLLIGSTIARQPPADLAIYAASKAAVEVAFKARARQWAAHGVRVNTLATGWVESAMTREIKPEKREKILRAIALKRMAEREEIARAALLALQMPYAVGDTFTVSGGL